MNVVIGGGGGTGNAGGGGTEEGVDGRFLEREVRGGGALRGEVENLQGDSALRPLNRRVDLGGQAGERSTASTSASTPGQRGSGGGGGVVVVVRGEGGGVQHGGGVGGGDGDCGILREVRESGDDVWEGRGGGGDGVVSRRWLWWW